VALCVSGLIKSKREVSLTKLDESMLNTLILCLLSLGQIGDSGWRDTVSAPEGMVKESWDDLYAG
jgi:hypothetical protein